MTQEPTPIWTPENLRSHQEAAQALETIKNASFNLISTHLRNRQPITEYEVQQFILGEFAAHGLISDGNPIVAANANSRFPHYTPTRDQFSPIHVGDFILIDIWAKLDTADAVFADITWVAFASNEVPTTFTQIFDIVRTARDLVVSKLQAAWQERRSLEGWQLDRLARDYITQKGFEKEFCHTTGHSLGSGESVHAPGVGLNDFSNHDTRPILSKTGFTIEPGIYLEEFGVRSEIDVYMDPEKGPLITTPAQTTIVTFL